MSTVRSLPSDCRSLPFTYKDLTKTNQFCKGQGTYNAELFLIVSSLAFYLWLRMDEALKLKSYMVHINLETDMHLINTKQRSLRPIHVL
jgi:hypothetical protein